MKPKILPSADHARIEEAAQDLARWRQSGRDVRDYLRDLVMDVRRHMVDAGWDKTSPEIPREVLAVKAAVKALEATIQLDDLPEEAGEPEHVADPEPPHPLVVRRLEHIARLKAEAIEKAMRGPRYSLYWHDIEAWAEAQAWRRRR